MPDRRVHLFPDTNALLHYPQIKDVDWCSIASADSVTLVLCLQVIRELDVKKSDARLRSRAERAIREISQLTKDGGAVRQGVTLEVFNDELRSSDFDVSLSPDSGDDRIIRHVQKYANAVNCKDVAVYSEDLGIQIRCSGHNITVIEPDKSSRLDDPQSELEKKYKAALIENQSLKNKLPELHVAIRAAGSNEDGNVIEFALSRVLADHINAEAEVEHERHSLALPPSAKTFSSETKVRSLRFSDLAGLHEPLTDEQREKYLDEVNSYLAAYKSWLTNDHAARASLERTIEFEIEISNDGRAIAEEVDVYVTLPSVFLSLVGEGEEFGSSPELPAKPKRPRRPRSGVLGALDEFMDGGASWQPHDSLPYHSLGTFAMPTIRTARDPWCIISEDGDDAVTIRIFVPRLNHHKHQVFGPFAGVLKSWTATTTPSKWQSISLPQATLTSFRPTVFSSST